jgi:hypothetical protein
MAGSANRQWENEMRPNFALLDPSRREIAILITAMLQAREAVDRHLWSHPQQHASEDWWADVLADPRTRRTTQASGRKLFGHQSKR